MTHGSLFSGIGGAELAAMWMGWDNAFHCEINPFCRKVLEYHFPNSTSYDDIKTTDFTSWRGRIDILTAGFPCQPFSLAGQRKGAEDDRYLWPQVVRAIREIRPAWVVGENVAGILTMVQPGDEVTVGSEAAMFGEADRERVLLRQEYVIETICRDLEREGYSVQPFVIPACAVGAPHRRDRVWIAANRDSYRQWNRTRQQVPVAECEGTANNSPFRQDGSSPHTERSRGREICDQIQSEQPDGGRAYGYGRERDDYPLPADRWRDFPTQSPVCGRDDGLSARLAGITFPKWRAESIKAYGNAWVPVVAFEIFRAIDKYEKDQA